MNEECYASKKFNIINKIIVIYIIFLAIILILTSFISIGNLEKYVYNYLAMNHMVQRIMGVVMLLFVSQLYKRVRAAWIATVVLIIVNIRSHIMMGFHPLHNWFILTEVIALIMLLLSYKYYCRSSDKRSVKKSILYFVVIMTVIFANAAVGYFDFQKNVTLKAISFWECVKKTWNMIIGSGDMLSLSVSHGVAYENFVFWFTWGCLLVCLALLFTPFIYKPQKTKADKEHARDLIKKYGQNPSAYLTLEEDKLYYFGKTIDGIVAYGIVGDTVVINGDPICADNDFTLLLSEFKNHCMINAYSMIFLSTTEKYIDKYKRLGFGAVKCGEEARIQLQDWSLKGGKIAKVRASINHAEKAGITVTEYKAIKEKNLTIEKEMELISQEWLSMKNSGELTFTLGKIGLDNPLDKRYFYARNGEGEMVGFIVLTPFASMHGYYTDITRRRKNIPGGVMEKLMYDIFMTLKEENIECVSLGLAPLVNTDEKVEGMTAKVFDYIYENLNSVYGFKDLYKAKLKYNPSLWKSCYFVFSTKMITPQMAYAVVKIQNPKGIMDYVKGFISSKKGKQTKAEMKKAIPEMNAENEEAEKNE